MPTHTLASLLGFGGAVTASSLFFPQVVVSYRRRKTDELSWFTIFIGMLNGVFWIGYGLLQHDPIIYITNILLFIGAGLLALLKKRYG